MSTIVAHGINERGFTLLELLLSMALMGTLAATTAGVYYTMQVKNGLDITATTLAQTLRRAQSLAQNDASDSNWGVYVQAGSITLFKGASYAGRDQSADEVAGFSTVVTATGTQEIDFTKFTGDPASTATFTLSTAADTKTVTVNSKGMVSL